MPLQRFTRRSTSGNILLGYTSLSQCGQLPETKLVDFGRALIQDREPTAEYTVKYNRAVRKDQEAFLRILALLVGVDVGGRSARGESPENRSWNWCDFKMCVLRGVKESSWDCEEALEDTQHRWGAFAGVQVENVDGKDMELVWDRVSAITQGMRGIVRGKIEELLDG
ncbi:hypothetical protein N0V86_009002 [Didymella sp. IMI 355093]|nr:hypothetical protein N0V86_009002 [Didymella sp. IMI 355093]